MTFGPESKSSSTKTNSDDTSRLDPLSGGTREWIAYSVGIVLTFVVFAWLFGAYEPTIDMMAVLPAGHIIAGPAAPVTR
jgi:hypothetical protein